MKPADRYSNISIFKFFISGIVIGVALSAIAVGAYHQSGDARFCGSCHSMKSVHRQWQASRHQQYTCTECHLPDTHLIGQVSYKIKAGLHDLIHETARDYPIAISLSGHARQIANGNCVRCHASTVAATPMAQGGADCLQCHRYLVHGRGKDQGGMKIEK